MSKRFDARPVQYRVREGKKEEAKCFECLNDYGFKLEPASDFEDRCNKTDAFWTNPETNERCRCAIKVRDTKNDILIAVYDPWFGDNHHSNVIGRDMKFEYKYYITRSVDKKKLRIASGKRIHQIVEDMMEELKESEFDFPLDSKKHPGCQLRKHVDRDSGLPKILGFVNPSYLKSNEIMYVPYTEKTKLVALEFDRRDDGGAWGN